MQQVTDSIRGRANKRAEQAEVLRRTALVTDRPVQMVATDPALPTSIIAPQCDEIVHIASVIPALLSVMNAPQRVLDGYRTAFLRRRWRVGGITYIIDDVFFSPEPRHAGKVFARLHEIRELEVRTNGQH